MEFDFSSDKPKRGPPARFALRQRDASSSSKESKPLLAPTNEATPGKQEILLESCYRQWAETTDCISTCK